MMKTRSILIRYYLFSFLTGLWLSGPVMVPFFKEWGGLNQLEIQLLQSWFMLISALIMVPTGVFADRYGRRKSVIIGLLLGAVACLWYGSIPKLWAFALGEVVFALHTGFILGADRALLTDNLTKASYPHPISRVLTTTFIAHMAGLLVANPIGSYIAGFGLNFTVLLNAIPLILAALVIHTLPESKGHPNTQTHWWHQTKLGLQYLLQHSQHSKPTLAAILTSTAGYFVIWLYPTLMSQAVPISEQYRSLSIAFGLMIGSEVIISLVFRRLNSLQQYKLLALGRWLTLFGFIAVLALPNIPSIAFFLVTAGGFGLSYWSLFTASLQVHLPANDQATIGSGAESLHQIMLIIANPLIGYLALTSPQPALFALILIAGLAVILKPRV